MEDLIKKYEQKSNFLLEMITKLDDPDMISRCAVARRVVREVINDLKSL